jgi:arabinogalactan endo-1,4-beta-galactosidase
MEKMQFAHRDENHTYSNIPDFIYNPLKGLDIGNFINIDNKKINFFDIVKEELGEFGIKKKYSDNVLRYIWDKPYEKFETVEAITLQM